MKYLFSLGAYAFDEECEDVRGQVELCALPEAIHSVLRSELPLPPSALAAEAPR